MSEDLSCPVCMVWDGDIRSFEWMDDLNQGEFHEDDDDDDDLQPHVTQI